jgi:methionyl-tRNA formyltransferase
MKILFMGERRIAMNCLRLLANTPKSASLELAGIVTNDLFFNGFVKEFGEYKELPFIKNDSRNSTLILEMIKALNIDAIISIQHNWIMPLFILDSVNGNSFNLHNAKLPDYKGYNSIFHAIANGDKTFTSTIHWMAELVDSGDIIEEGVVEINQNDTALSLYIKSVDAATIAFEKFLEYLRIGSIPRRPMLGAGVFYNRHDQDIMRNISDIYSFANLDKIIRASYFPPYETVYTIINGQQIYINKSLAHKAYPLFYNKSDWELS